MSSAEITLPVLEPRSWQQEVLAAWTRGTRRLVVVVHRRSGKTSLLLALLSMAMVERVGTYYYITPQFVTGRRIVWDGLDHLGRPMLDAFPAELVAGRNEVEMQVTLRNRSVFQILGADQADRVRGTNPVGVAFDEYALMPGSEAWDVTRPILAENGGFAVFAFTPQGRNHAHELYEKARQEPEWFTTRKTVADTRRDAPGESGGPIITTTQIAQDIREGMPKELADQEYYTSFVAAMPGAYYAQALEEAERERRIRRVPWEPTLPVTTAWDLGIDDVTAIVFAQVSGIEVRIIDYLEQSGEGFAYYAKRLGEQRYRYAEHLLPHDADVRELGTGKSRAEALRAFGLSPVRVLPQLPVADGVEQVRMLLPRCYFDQDRCRPLLRALESYRKDWDEEKKTFALKPRHDWASHGADAFRYLAVGLRPTQLSPRPRPRAVPGPGYRFTTGGARWTPPRGPYADRL
ncbi:MAG: terminase large subunit [Candidatus Rokubacteria bacterium]|nr:terminase large subunit [Candidatus Rokubacteria bacterium]